MNNPEQRRSLTDSFPTFHELEKAIEERMGVTFVEKERWSGAALDIIIGHGSDGQYYVISSEDNKNQLHITFASHDDAVELGKNLAGIVTLPKREEEDFA